MFCHVPGPYGTDLQNKETSIQTFTENIFFLFCKQFYYLPIGREIKTLLSYWSNIFVSTIFLVKVLFVCFFLFTTKKIKKYFTNEKAEYFCLFVS